MAASQQGLSLVSSRNSSSENGFRAGMLLNLQDFFSRFFGRRNGGWGTGCAISIEPDIDQLLRRKSALRTLEAAKEATERITTREMIYSALVEALKERIEKSSRSSDAHSYCVGLMAERIAEAMGLQRLEVLQMAAAGYIHDIGKFNVPLAILLKRRKLTELERLVISLHPEASERMCAGALGERFAELLPVIRHHHERWDGVRGIGVGKPGGYPDGLKGEGIPLGARILAVADTYDALVNERPWRRAYSSAEAVRMIKAEAGKQFDPNVVEAFLSVMRVHRAWRKEIGSF